MSSNKHTTVLSACKHAAGLFVVFALFSLSVHAQPSMEACSAVADPEQRLACYDRAMGVAGEEQSNEVPATNAAPEGAGDDFGLPPRGLTDEEINETRFYTVSSASRTDFTGWRLHFENGEVWRQVGTDRYDIEIGATYVITRNAFNSYFLGNEANRRKMRVTRVE